MSLNEVQSPKELQGHVGMMIRHDALPSMKCSPRRNCKSEVPEDHDEMPLALNEVQSPRDLQAIEDLESSIVCSDPQ